MILLGKNKNWVTQLLIIIFNFIVGTARATYYPLHLKINSMLWSIESVAIRDLAINKIMENRYI